MAARGTGASLRTRYLLLACLLCPGLGGTAPGGRLRLEAARGSLQAGHEQAARLTVRGSVEALQDVSLTCTPGSVEGLEQVGPQELTARYVLPRAPEPEWVLCAAVSPPSYAVVRLEQQRRQLLALADLPPLGRVEVRLGSTSYGPVRANSAGQAEVSVLLSPAVRQADIQVTPPGGPTTQRTEALALPPGEQLLLVAGASTRILANGSQGVPVWLFMLGGNGELQDLPVQLKAQGGRTPVLRREARGVRSGMFVPYAHSSEGQAVLTASVKGGRSAVLRLDVTGGVTPHLLLEAPVRGLPADGAATVELVVRVSDKEGQGLSRLVPRLKASMGTLGPLVEREPGVFVAKFTAPATQAAAARLVAELPGAEPASLQLKLTPPPRLSLRADALQVPADGQSRVAMHVAARGPDGRELPDGTPLQVRTSLGTAPASVRISRGQAQVHLVAGTRAGEAVVEVQALEVTERVVVRFLPGAPARLTLRPLRRAVQCDGKDGTALRLSVEDEHGNGLESAPIALEVGGAPKEQLGELGAVAALGGGEFIVRYQAPAHCLPGPVEITASSQGVQGKARLERVAAFGPIGLTARAGVHAGPGAVTPSVEVEVDAPTPWAGRLLASLSFQLAFGRLATSGSLSLVSLHAGPRWELLRAERLAVYAGAGLDGHLLQVVPPGGEEVMVGAALGLHVRAGVRHALGPGEVVLQGRYRPFAFAPPGAGGLVAGATLDAGYRVAF